MCAEQQENFEIRTLVLKRWDASQTKNLFGNSNLPRGQFISFQSHHFIDIIPTTEGNGLLAAYNNLRKPYAFLRENKETNNTKVKSSFPDIHVVQNMPLLGKCEDFWDNKANVLNITLIQISDSSKWEYDRIYNEINTYFKNNCSEATTPRNWALYYSLDYCDYVLFTKDIKLNVLNNLLWKMALVREGNFNIIRDTFTIHSFGWEYLQNVFTRFMNPDKKDEPIWDDTMSLSMNFCLRDVSVVERLKAAIDSIDNHAIKYSDTRLSGRYDLNITTEIITGTQVLKVLLYIDNFLGEYFANTACTNAPPPFSEYEIMLMSSLDNDLPNKSTPPSGTDFDKYATAMIGRIYSVLVGMDANGNSETKVSYIDYVKEALRSIYELAKIDFSEEFVLSVLPSLITFLRIAKQKQSFLANEENPKYFNAIKSSCAKLQKSYFTALNTLSLCTMHSERQFIHTPSFNANFFDIPPKLLAYYNAVAYKIAYYLKEASFAQPSYHYVITPDYRPDIHVEPLNISYRLDTKEHLAIINLPEKFFYQPQKAIMLFAHEVGHYEGDRKREIRAKHIFHLIGIVILYHTPLITLVEKNQVSITENNLIGLLAASFGTFLQNQYDEQHTVAERGIEYLLKSISNFLEVQRYGLAFFEVPGYRDKIISNWIEVIKDAGTGDPVNHEMREMLTTLSEKENTNYFLKLAQTPECIGARDAIARNIANRCGVLSFDGDGKYFASIARLCQHIIELFSESYADMQMATVFGNDYFNLNHYRKMLEEIENEDASADSYDYTFTEVQELRYNIMLRNFSKTGCPTLNLLQETVIDSVMEYLRKCGFSSNASLQSTPTMEKMLNAIYPNQTNWKKWCESLCDELSNYEKSLQEMYKQDDKNII